MPPLNRSCADDREHQRRCATAIAIETIGRTRSAASGTATPKSTISTTLTQPETE